jgi:hypothetical protein
MRLVTWHQTDGTHSSLWPNFSLAHLGLLELFRRKGPCCSVTPNRGFTAWVADLGISVCIWPVSGHVPGTYGRCDTRPLPCPPFFASEAKSNNASTADDIGSI